MAGSDFARQLEGYGLATVQTHYYMPGYPSQLQMYVMLQYDIAPRFRDLDRFLAFCRREIETVLHSVRAAPGV